jgi:hypothetical protein
MKYICLILLFVLASQVHAQYVLPYPGPMPGNKLYQVMRLVDELQKFWYWGNIAKFKFNLGLSDKYLVEAKILFEYRQYFLAVESLKRSDLYFNQLPLYINGAKSEGKDVNELQKTYGQAVKKHIEVLLFLKEILPETFEWTPEKSQPTLLLLHEYITASTALRNKTSL